MGDCDCDCGDCDCGDCDCDCGDCNCDCGHCCACDDCCKDCPFCCNICTAFTCAHCCEECCEDACCDVCYVSPTERTDYRERNRRRRQPQEEFSEPVPSYGGVDKEIGFPDGPPPSYNEVVFTQPGDMNGGAPGYGTGVITSQPGSAVGAPNTSI